MQISASTLLASQQPASISRAPEPGFAQALEKAEGFAPLPLKQVASPSERAAPTAPPKSPARLGSTLDIKV